MNGRCTVRSWIATLAIALALGVPAVGNAAFGDVDTTFGDLGSAPLAGTPQATPAAGRVSIVPNATGFSLVGDSGDGRRNVLVDVPHGPTGSLLPNAERFTPVGVGNARQAHAMAAPDGGTYVSFHRHMGTGNTVALARFRPDRTLDSAFGSGGVVTLPSVGGRPQIVDIDDGPAGTVLIAVTTEDFDGVNRGLLIRFLPTGALDASFGAGGIVSFDLGSNNDGPTLTAMVVDSTTGVVTASAGTYDGALPFPNLRISVFRFLATGAPDLGFSGDGRTDTLAPPEMFPSDLAVDGSGRTVVAGTRFGASSVAVVLRLTSSGAMDATFDGDGIRDISLTGSTGTQSVGLVVDGPGAITVVGQGSFASAPTSRLFLARITSGGVADGTFGGATGSIEYAAAPIDEGFVIATVGATTVVAGGNVGVGGHGWMGVNATGAVVFSGFQTPVGAPTGRALGRAFARPDGGAFGLQEFFSGTTIDIASVTPTGAPDLTLAGTGSSTLTVPAAGKVADARRLGSGAIVIAGGQSPGTSAFVARFRAEGGADPSFGGGDGVVTATPAAGALDFTAVSDNPDGSIVAAGFGTTPARFEVRKYLADGSSDPAFGGGDGIADILTPTLIEVPSMGRTPNGSIVVVGRSTTSAILVRLTPSGDLDGGFGTGGTAVIPLADGYDPQHGVVDSKGRVLIGLGDAPTPEGRVLRVLPTGAVDPSFGTAGLIAIPPIRTGFSLRPEGAAVLADDSYVTAANELGDPDHTVMVRIDSAGGLTVRDTTLQGLPDVSAVPDGRLIVAASHGNGISAVRMLGSPPAPPTVTAGAPTETSLSFETTAEAAGFTGVDLVTENGPTAALGAAAAPVALAATQGPQKFSRSITGLVPGQPHHIRATLRNASGSATSATLVATTPRIAPSSRVTLPRKAKRKVPASWRILRGTAVDPAPSSGIAKVEVSLYRRAGKRCIALTARGLRRMTCARALTTFVPARGTTSWTRRVPALVAGRYTLRVRATDGAGVPQAGFVAGQSKATVTIAKKKAPKKKKVVKKRP
jgi:uncharacterized delta-60 repeat protein